MSKFLLGVLTGAVLALAQGLLSCASAPKPRPCIPEEEYRWDVFQMPEQPIPICPKPQK